MFSLSDNHKPYFWGESHVSSRFSDIEARLAGPRRLFIDRSGLLAPSVDRGSRGRSYQSNDARNVWLLAERSRLGDLFSPRREAMNLDRPSLEGMSLIQYARLDCSRIHFLKS